MDGVMAAREPIGGVNRVGPTMDGATRQVRVWEGVNQADQTMVAGKEEISAGMLVMVVVMATSNAGNGRLSP